MHIYQEIGMLLTIVAFICEIVFIHLSAFNKAIEVLKSQIN